ncbi:MAG: hypothetical protein LBT31_10375 [Synergistaceae bacterium]|nr:hypothetical protein [Synergistaceae bacterium]
MKTRRIPLAITAVIAAILCSAVPRPISAAAHPPGFVRVSDMIPDVTLDIRYFGTDNVIYSHSVV